MTDVNSLSIYGGKTSVVHSLKWWGVLFEKSWKNCFFSEKSNGDFHLGSLLFGVVQHCTQYFPFVRWAAARSRNEPQALQCQMALYIPASIHCKRKLPTNCVTRIFYTLLRCLRSVQSSTINGARNRTMCNLRQL